MTSRSYIKITRNAKHASTFTTIPTATTKAPRARRRRLKDKRVPSHSIGPEHDSPESHNIKAAITSPPVEFDEPSVSNLSATATPFKPTRILTRPKASKPASPPLNMHNHTNKMATHGQKQISPPFSRSMSEETHKQLRPNSNPNYRRNAQNGQNRREIMDSPPILRGKSAKDLIMKARIRKHSMTKAKKKATPPGLVPINSTRKRKHKIDKILKRNKLSMKSNRYVDIDSELDRRKSIAFLKMLDDLDTDDMFDEIMNDKGNYDIPKNHFGLFTSYVWDPTIKHDGSSWDWVY